eukprot:SAG31_NODE_7440_length_1688_cov_4.226558_1_plen_109_part_00
MQSGVGGLDQLFRGAGVGQRQCAGAVVLDGVLDAAAAWDAGLVEALVVVRRAALRAGDRAARVAGGLCGLRGAGVRLHCGGGWVGGLEEAGRVGGVLLCAVVLLRSAA